MLRALVCAALTAVALTGCGDDEDETAATPTPAATTTVTPEPTASPTESPAAEIPQVLWPETPAADPETAAESFATEYAGIPDPALGEFRETGAGAGEIDVFRRGEDGSQLEVVLTTIELRELGGDGWSVTQATSDEVQIDEPAPGADVLTPVTIRGEGRGFEGNVVLEVREAFATQALAEQSVIAGPMADREAFIAELTFNGSGPGAIVARTGSGLPGPGGFAAFPVSLSG